jgi:1-acyl-sn-glycerol-3-phosphate acyltransferase
MTIIYNIFYTLAKWLARLFFDFRVIHPERIPEEGGVILASNHQSYFDPPLVGICSHRGVHYLARKTLLQWPFFGPLFPAMNVIPVDRDGNDMAALKTVIRKIRQGEGVVLFPEGTRTRDGNLQPAQAGVGLVIAKTGAPVVPMRIFGAYEAFPRGAKRVRLHPIRVVVGNPIHFSPEELAGADRETYRRLGQRVMDEIAALELEPESK